MTEQQLMDNLAVAEENLRIAQSKLREANKRWIEAESVVVAGLITRDRIKEELREYRNTTPRYELSDDEKEVEAFRQKFPELCAEAKQRDIDKCSDK